MDFLNPLHQEEQRKKKRHSRLWLGLALFFIGALITAPQNIGFLRISVLPTAQHVPFDGTVFPVEKVPAWVKLSAAEYKLPFDQIPADKLVSIPTYDPSQLQIPADSLKWNNPSDDVIRIAKITYSVPYMGSYRLNGKEYDGGHLAVDIKIPEKTPVVAIANGVVTKVSNITNGFGKHVVLEHRNVPSYEDASKKITLSSAYNHLGLILVNEGDVVRKGQLIAYSGSTGFATTPHLHFQIDREDAPWHPYWAFTFKEASDAGFDFVGAVNAGIGKEKAVLMTVPPMQYVQKYLNYVASAESVSSPSLNPSSSPSSAVASSSISETAPPPAAPPAAPKFERFDFEVDSSFRPNIPVSVTVLARDTNGGIGASFEGDAILMITGNVGVLQKATLNASDFVNGKASVMLQDVKPGKGQLVVLYQGTQFSSIEFEVLSPPEPVTVPAPETPAPPSVPSSVPSSAAATPPLVSPVVIADPYKGKLFVDVFGNHPNYAAIAYLKNHSILRGYDDGTFKPDQKVSRVEALKIILKGANRSIIVLNPPPAYKDVNYKAWYGVFVMTAYQNNIARGYLDDTFRPNHGVTRAEFIKMLLSTLGVPLEPVASAKPYEDVATDSWFAPYVVYAKDRNLLPAASATFRADEEITREEVAEILFRVLVLKETNAVAYSSNLVYQ